MTDSGSPAGPSLQAQEAYADFILRRERGEAPDFEDLCRRNPDLADDLRRLNGDWQRLETVCLEKLGQDSLASTMLIRGKPTQGAADVPNEARAIFSDYLLAVEAGNAPPIQELYKKFPAFAEALKELHDSWEEFEKAFETITGTVALDKTFLIRHGRDALEDAQWESGQSGHLIERLVASRVHDGHHYSMCGEVARGGMGAILKVWDPNLRRNLAMKVIHEGFQQGDVRKDTSAVDNVLARFLEEAQVTGQLDHPGIVPVYELGVDEKGRCYFTMRLVRGRDLLKIYELVWKELEGWNVTRALSTLLTVCDAMSYAHNKKVLHRDLKPANVMVGRFGETYVMDWGLARVMGKKETRDIRPADEQTMLSLVQTDRKDESGRGGDDLRTMDGDVIGTPAYMAPEQARGALSEIGPHTDVYSIGAMLYHLLARRAPYIEPDKSLTGRDIWHKVLAGPPAPLDEREPRPPAELVAICEKAMAREIGARYASTAQLAEDLRAFLEGRVVKAYETGPMAEFRKWVKRNRFAAGTVMTTIAAVVVALLGTNFVLADQKHDAVVEKKVAVQERVEAVEKKEEAEEQRDVEERRRKEVEEAKAAVDRANAALEEKKKELEAANADLEDARARAEENFIRANNEKQRVLRLADAKRLEQLVDRADRLWPAVPAMAPELQRWLAPAEELFARVGDHRATLGDLRSGAAARSTDELDRDQRTHPLAEQLLRTTIRRDELAAEIAELEAAASTVASRDLIAEKSAERDAAAEQVAALSSVVLARRVWEFSDPEVQWHHDLLAQLVDDLGGFESTIASVQSRLSLSRRIEEETIERYRDRWDAARRSIADEAECPRYGGLLIEPQVGLVPLSKNAEGLWEFAHVPTGAVPELNASGRWKLSEETAVVLVLVPGGVARNGAEVPNGDSRIRSDPNVYDGAFADEGPIHEVELDPFFVSKYEMTQAQWSAATGATPSRYGPVSKDVDGRDRRHPVESVSWNEAKRVLWELGLSLPTEAQWEYVARAGKGTPWFTGLEFRSLHGLVNLADLDAKDRGAPENWPFMDMRDGFLVHAPVDALASNDFGLKNVLGNVSEWCLDGYAAYSDFAPLPGTGERRVPAPDKRVVRGGSFLRDYDSSTASYRRSYSADDNQSFLGVRPVRAIDE